MLASTLTPVSSICLTCWRRWVVPDLAITARLVVGDKIGSTIWALAADELPAGYNPGEAAR